MWIKGLIGLAVTALVATGAWLVLGNNHPAGAGVELLNVSYDPTRELWHDLNAQFVPRYEKETGTPVTIRQSHGGSGTQARERPNIREVAAVAGVSISAVSLAINGKPGVSAAKRARVLQTVQELGYVRNGSSSVVGTRVLGLLMESLSIPAAHDIPKI